MSGGDVVAAVAAVLAIPPLLCAGYLAALSVAAAFRRSAAGGVASQLRLAVVIPAHDEGATLVQCLNSLHAQTYPKALTRVVVIADNCADDTAAVARSAGAEVLIRHDEDRRGKGHALRWAFDRILSDEPAVDAVVVVDADSLADEHMLAALAARATRGRVVQADYQVLSQPNTRSELRAAAFLLFHRARFLGRDALGMGCALVGNGMLFRREVLEEVPWTATTAAEDLEYTVTLRLNGVVPRYARDAHLWAPAPTGGRAGQVQRARWEGGRFYVVRTGLPRLIRSAWTGRSAASLDMAMDLATPPLGLLVLTGLLASTLTAALALAGRASAWAAFPWLAVLAAIGIHVTVGLAAAGAPARTWSALAMAPWFLVLKCVTYARLTRRGLGARDWERTPRTALATNRPHADAPDGGELATSDDCIRVRVAGVPIDVVDRGQAVGRMMRAIETRRFLQVCTVNLQFLTTARRHAEVRATLVEAGLNVADGAPVVWLARRLGARVPERVAGADLVPDLIRSAAATGRRVFVLGGRDGVAAEAAAAIRRTFPGIVVAGTYEPAHTSLDGLPTDEIMSRLSEAQADILLVGLGHPKQDLWIHRNRDRLPVSVAVGVGCTLELVASRIGRAPSWMQRRGLEWLYRLSRTPGRLFWRYTMCAVTLVAVFAPAAVLQAIVGRDALIGGSPSSGVEHAG